MTILLEFKKQSEQVSCESHRYSKEQCGGGKKKSHALQGSVAVRHTVGKQPNGGMEAFEKEQESPQMLGTLKVLGRACFKRRPKEEGTRPGEHCSVSWEFWNSGKERHGCALKRKLFHLLLYHGLGESTFQGVVP